MEYQDRIIDSSLLELSRELPALVVTGAKGVGKTETAKRLAKLVLDLDIDMAARALVSSKNDLQALRKRPILIDEWAREPISWDVVRRIVDEDSSPGHFILTGSASNTGLNIHSGAGRIVQIFMRPLSWEERKLCDSRISLQEMVDGEEYIGIYEKSDAEIIDYAHEIFASGFPGIRGYSDRGIKELLRGYVDTMLNKEFEELGIRVRKPGVLRSWLTAYAAASATTVSYAKILRAATPGEEKQPAEETTLVYRDALDRLYLTDRVDPWLPSSNTLTALGRSQKHYLVDPAIALSLLGYSTNSLITGGKTTDVGNSRDNSVLGRLFESLVASSLKVYTQKMGGQLYHFRSSDGRHEIDFIIEHEETLIALEVKLATQILKADVSQLNWLESKLDDTKRFVKVIVTVGSHAYRREDGVLVIPFALLRS